MFLLNLMQEYERNNARIKYKKDQDLMANITKGLERMLKLKINAVRVNINYLRDLEALDRNFY